MKGAGDMPDDREFGRLSTTHDVMLHILIKEQRKTNELLAKLIELSKPKIVEAPVQKPKNNIRRKGE
jgi:hypothetical protein